MLLISIKCRRFSRKISLQYFLPVFIFFSTFKCWFFTKIIFSIIENESHDVTINTNAIRSQIKYSSNNLDNLILQIYLMKIVFFFCFFVVVRFDFLSLDRFSLFMDGIWKEQHCWHQIELFFCRLLHLLDLTIQILYKRYIIYTCFSFLLHGEA